MTLRDDLEEPEFRAAFVSADVYQRIALSIRSLRKQRGWSQAQLAMKMGCKQSTISRLEDPDNERLAVSTLVRLSEAFDAPLFIAFPSWDDWLANTADWSPENFIVPPYKSVEDGES